MAEQDGLESLTRWVEVDLDAVEHNAAQVRSLLSPETKLCAVVKGGGYGFGLEVLGRFFEEVVQAEMLAVTYLEEGVQLRQAGVRAPVLVLSPLLESQAAAHLAHGLTPVVDRLEALKAWEACGGRDYHLEVDTGMGRNGVAASEAGEFLRVQAEMGMNVVGLMTHLAKAGYDREFTRIQHDRFQAVYNQVSTMGLSVVRHVANSAAGLTEPTLHLDMVRVGTALYGQMPPGVGPETCIRRLDLKDPFRMRARVVHVGTVHAGSSVGYGGDYVAKKPTQVAVVACGWADGVGVAPQARAGLVAEAKRVVKALLGRDRPSVVLGGKRLPVLGRVGMQSMMVLGEGVSPGMVVDVPVRRMSVRADIPRVCRYRGRRYP